MAVLLKIKGASLLLLTRHLISTPMPGAPLVSGKFFSTLRAANILFTVYVRSINPVILKKSKNIYGNYSKASLRRDGWLLCNAVLLTVT
jgi:hypothetical protein